MAKNYIHQTLRFFTKDLEDLTKNCKLSWPHSAPEDSINIPPIFRCEEHLYTKLRWSVGWSVRWSVRWSVCPHDARLRGKIIVTARLIREEEEEEDTDHVAIPLWRVLRT